MYTSSEVKSQQKVAKDIFLSLFENAKICDILIKVGFRSRVLDSK
jgi:hypothetical protein